jgi:hypothetical protein
MIQTPKRIAAAEKRAARTRLRTFCNSISLKQPKFAHVVHCCCLCMTPIEKGDEYRDGGPGRRVHEFCFDALAKDLK